MPADTERTDTRPAHPPLPSAGPADQDFVVVANRLPVDRRQEPDGTTGWTRSPGGLVTALSPVMATGRGAWVGWAGAEEQTPAPFEHDGIFLWPVELSADDVAEFYEGFSNATLWPLYHDVIATPVYHREWWEAYQRVNRRFAKAAAAVAAPGATVWVHDYQLQLVPGLLRADRPDLRIGYFHHIPFPPYELFAQLPWRKEIVEGLLGADVLGFQRGQDAANLLRAARRALGLSSQRGRIQVDGRPVLAKAFPISIDSARLDELAGSEEIQARAQQIRDELGHPKNLLLGVDRLDYTKGIGHRLKAFSELLDEGRLDPKETVLVQVATPSRERVEEYRRLRDEIELTVGRINGRHGLLERSAVTYLHRSYPQTEMAALYSVADVMLVTPLRDGMNLVAKEYVACRRHLTGALVLSEFTGAAEQLHQAVTVNPHDIEGLKSAILAAVALPTKTQRTRMRSLRRQVMDNDVNRWAHDFLTDLGAPESIVPAVPRRRAGLDDALRALAARRPLLIGLDFDGVLAPLVDDPAASRALPESQAAISRLAQLPRVQVALISGRRLTELRTVAAPPEGVVLIGSHGAEQEDAEVLLSPAQKDLLARIGDAIDDIVLEHPGTRTEFKPTTVVLHTRLADDPTRAAATELALAGPGSWPGVRTMHGKDVVELGVLEADKGSALVGLALSLDASGIFFAGDDVTDEFALRRLDPSRDVGVKVGRGRTAAAHRVADPKAFAGVLTRLADFLEG